MLSPEDRRHLEQLSAPPEWSERYEPLDDDEWAAIAWADRLLNQQPAEANDG